MMLHEDGVNQTGMRPIQEVPIVETESITAVVKDGIFADKGDDHHSEMAEALREYLRKIHTLT